MDLSRSDNIGYRELTLRRNWALGFIFLSTIFENCAFSALTFTFIPNLSPKFVQTYVILAMYVISYFVAFLTGFISDSTIGRFKLICSGYFLYILGYTSMFLSVNENPFGCPLEKMSNETAHTGHNELKLASKGCSSLFFISLTFSACGAGFIWGNIPVLGADQTKDENVVPNFYHAYYFFKQVGISIACFSIFNADIKNTNWLMTGGFGSILLSSFFFLMGREVYVSASPDPQKPDNPAVILFDVLKAAFSPGNRRRFTDLCSQASGNRAYVLSRVDLVSIEFGGQFTRLEIDAVKRYLRLLYLFLTLVTFELIYIQQLTTFGTQGLHMKIPSSVLDTHTTPPSLIYPILWFSSGYNLFTLLVLIPAILFASYVITNFRVSLTMETVAFRLTVGMICSGFHGAKTKQAGRLKVGALVGLKCPFSAETFGVLLQAISMFCAGAVETYRELKEDPCDDEGACGFKYVYQGIVYEASEMSILWQMPQFVFAAIAEIFVRITALQLAYLETPITEHSKMHGLFIGIVYFSETLGAVSAMVSLYSGKSYSCKEVGDDDCNPNGCKLYVYFFVLAFVQIIGVVWNKVTVKDYFRWTATGQGFFF